MIQTSSFTSGVSLHSLFADAVLVGVPDIAVTDITSDSRNACAGGLFLACEGGARHGLEFVDQAIAAKVAAVAWEPDAKFAAPQLPAEVIGLEVPNLGAQVGAIADQFFGRPSAQLTITGVTGTNGKTTVARLASSALALLNGPAGYMGTLGYGIGENLQSSALTTPGCIVVHRRLRDLLEAGASSVVMEVSSHGLDQGRIDGVRITTAALTNLSRDHLDYHGSLEAYGDAKAKLFSRAGLQTAVVNVTDEFGATLANSELSAASIIRVGVGDSDKHSGAIDLLAQLLDANETGLRVRFSGRFGEREFTSPMWGRFNVENLVLAAGIIVAHGFSLPQAATALEHLPAPAGRMQVLQSGADRPTVIIDFAHTPAALELALSSLVEHIDGNIWCVFGCGGNRDQGKRALMGEVAAVHADHVIVTTDNPRDEDPVAIAQDILSGMHSTQYVDVIADRAIAIQTAIQSAAPGDAVLIAGKGSETYQLIGDQRIAFADVEVATAALGGAN